MPSWIIELGGERFDLQELLRLSSYSGVAINEEAGRFYLRADDLEDCSEPRKVLARARDIVDVLNGIAELQIENWEHVQVAGVARDEANGTRTQFLFPEPIRSRSRMSGSLTVTRADGTVESSQHDGFQTFAALAEMDGTVRRALRLFGSEPHDWVNLYGVYEIIEADAADNRGIIESGWATKSEISNFKHTANSLAAAGDLARHGKERTDPPRSPMDLVDAQSLIVHLLKNWLQSKE